jgi:hypothetical protein
MANKYDGYRHQFSAVFELGDPWGSICLDELSSTNVFVFHTWGGDGRFPSFYGYDANGKLVCLITDMFLHGVVFEGWQSDG